MQNENKKHVHCDVIIAYANGAEIEVNTGGGLSPDAWEITRSPLFLPNFQYRVKKKTMVLPKHRRALMKNTENSYWIYTQQLADVQGGSDCISSYNHFVQWIDEDYVDITVELK